MAFVEFVDRKELTDLKRPVPQKKKFKKHVEGAAKAVKEPKAGKPKAPAAAKAPKAASKEAKPAAKPKPEAKKSAPKKDK
jgi:hypothetical protein